MTYWDGTRWIPEPSPRASELPSPLRRLLGAGAEAALITLLMFGLIAGTALAAPGSGKGGSGSGVGVSYTGTLAATPHQLHSGEHFDVHGCGYDTELGNVWLTFTGGSWGSPLDANGCFSITSIPALSGDTLPPGTYEVKALQMVGKRWRVTGETYVTVVP